MSLATAFNYFANSLWQVPLLVFCCWCALRLMRASARLQYGACIVTLLLCVALPWRGANPGAEPVVTASTLDAEAFGEFLHPLPASPLPFYAVRIRPHTRDLLAECYLLLTALLLLRLLASQLLLRRLVHASPVRLPSHAEQALLASCGNAGAELRLLPPGRHTPMVAGILHPVVLLPQALLLGEPDALAAVLAHELAHIRRRDTLTNLVLRAVALPIAYHPAAVLLERRIRQTRELVCDAIAARALPSPAAYAHILLTLAQQLVHLGDASSHGTVGFFERTSKPLLEERIMTLITLPRPLRPAVRALRFTLAVALLTTAAATVSFVHLAPTVLAAQEPVAQQPTIPPVAQPSKSQQSAAVAATLPSTATAGSPLPASMPAVSAKSEEAASQQEIGLPAADTDKLAAAMAELSKAQDSLVRQRPGPARLTIDAATLNRSMDELRARLKSPEFRQQIAAASAEATRAALQSEQYREQMADLRKQLDSPEFRKEIQQAVDAASQAKNMPPMDLARLAGQSRELAQMTAPAAPQTDVPAARLPAAVMAGQIVSKVTPVYPPEAKAAGVSGTVVMRAVIGKDGLIQKLEAVSGPDVLRASALDAVRQWVYKPYLLNGQPTELRRRLTSHTHSAGNCFGARLFAWACALTDGHTPTTLGS